MMISVEEAQKRILASVHPIERETVPLLLSSGRFLAEEIVSSLDYPPWDVSAMDGYAVQWSDTILGTPAEPSRLKVIEHIPAGTMPQKVVTSGTASKIMTGAPMPSGADAIVVVEETTQDGEDVLIYGEARRDFIRYRGEVVRKGDVVLKKGKMIRPYEIAMMASLGVSEVLIFRRPRVAILSTGNELVDLHEPRDLHQIYNSNGYGLAAQVEEACGVPILLGIARDTREDLIDKLKGASDADFIIISGGVSAGDYDFVKEIFGGNPTESAKGLLPLNTPLLLGAKALACPPATTWPVCSPPAQGFHKVAMKPGAPLAFGAIFGKPAFGLPGNPVSAMVTFDQFVRPALLYAQGCQSPFRTTVYAELIRNIKKKDRKRHYVRGRLSIKDGAYQVVPTESQDSANMLTLVQANALIVLGEEEGDVQAGARVAVQMID